MTNYYTAIVLCPRCSQQIIVPTDRGVVVRCFNCGCDFNTYHLYGNYGENRNVKQIEYRQLTEQEFRQRELEIKEKQLYLKEQELGLLIDRNRRVNAFTNGIYKTTKTSASFLSNIAKWIVILGLPLIILTCSWHLIFHTLFEISGVNISRDSVFIMGTILWVILCLPTSYILYKYLKKQMLN